MLLCLSVRMTLATLDHLQLHSSVLSVAKELTVSIDLTHLKKKYITKCNQFLDLLQPITQAGHSFRTTLHLFLDHINHIFSQ